MKIQLRTFVVVTALIGTVLLQVPLTVAAQETPPATEPSVHRTPQELDILLAPIALYPDPLLAQILPASTVPQEIVAASRYVASEKELVRIDQQSWQEGVKALAHYPDILKMMSEKLDWMTELGAAFVAQPDDVFASIQRLRGQAAAVGNLKNSRQQVVSRDKEMIRIMPANPQVIYVPKYLSSVIYTQTSINPAVPLLSFGAGFAMGTWIHNEIDWQHHRVDCNEGWHEGVASGATHR